MQWDRRVALGSSATVAILAALSVWYVFGRTPPQITYLRKPTYASSPLFSGAAMGDLGIPLTTKVLEPALVVVPSELPAWARAQIEHQLGASLMRQTQFIWDGHSALFQKARGWAITGLYPATVKTWTPVLGMSRTVLQAAAGATQYTRGPLTLKGSDWSIPVVREEKLAWNLALTRSLQPLLGTGGVVAVIDGQGQLMTLSGNPSDRGLAWQPHPVGLGLVPCLMAEALAEPRLLNEVKNGQNMLKQLSDAWGSSKIQRALQRLGLGAPQSIKGQPVTNPPLPHPSPEVMSQGHALWATPLEMARAYLPFIRHGAIAPITPYLATQAIEPGQPLVAPPSTLLEVTRGLPILVMGGIRFSVWRPDGNFAVAYTATDGGLIVVVEGPATNNTIALIHAAGVWLNQLHGQKKGISG